MTMDDPSIVEAGEHTAEDLLEKLHDGQRLVVRKDVLGSEQEITLRYDGSVYYCDTPTTLHEHETPEEMMNCMRNQGYVSDA